jgi:hypothetical protein
MPFRENHIYPLKDTHRYDDDLGEGYDHALLADRGPVPEGCWVHDAWIVRANGMVHPGLDASPVPVRLEDVEETRGGSFVRPGTGGDLRQRGDHGQAPLPRCFGADHTD